MILVGETASIKSVSFLVFHCDISLQVQLQNMMTSKFVGYFLEQVSQWQKKLSTTDSVIVIWFEVQRTWSHLESIFIGSEDIRAQLPEHSKQFDKIDTDFKVHCYSYRGGLQLASWPRVKGRQRERKAWGRG